MPEVGALFLRCYQEHLPFELTNAQKETLRAIRQDLAQPQQMNRMVQGDVGSGKTIVAILAALMVMGQGQQAALMAPTEILAEQHLRGARKLLEPLGLQAVLVAGSQRKKGPQGQRELPLAAGEAGLAVGTHALIEDPVQFHTWASR